MVKMKLILLIPLIVVSNGFTKSKSAMDLFCNCRNMSVPPTNVPQIVPANVTPSTGGRILMGEPISQNDLQYLAVLYTESVEECDFSKFRLLVHIR